MRILPHLVIAALVSGQDRPTLKEWKKTQAEKKEASAADAAKEDKMAAVRKVIDLLADLKKTVLSEGEKEAKSYNKFACFCKDTMAEKDEAITKGEDDKDSLSTHISGLGDRRDDLDTEIEDYEKDIEELEKFMKEKTKKRKEDNEVYEKNAKDLKDAIEAVASALQTLKASKPSFLQIRSIASNVRQAVLLADAMGLSGTSRAALNMFLQDDPNVPMENYKFHSQPVIDLLEPLHKDLRKEKAELDSDEVDAVQRYDKYMLDKNFDVKTKTMQMERAKKKKADTIEEIAMSSAQLSTVAATLLDDKDYLMELGKLCGDKAKTWDQRSKTRTDELSALTSAIAIIKGEVSEKTTAATVRLAQRGTSVRLALKLKPDTLDQIEMEAEALENRGKTVSFLQRAIHQHNGDQDAQQTVAALLKSQGTQLHSTLLTALASQIAADPFAKVKTLIEELIARLQHEATEEADHKSFCDKSIGEAEDKRDRAADKIEELNNKMAGLENNRDKLNEEIDSLTKEITDLEQARKDADDARTEEKAENKATVDTATEGLDALKTAISTLEDFYKNAKDESVDLGLIQSHGPADDAPDTGFDAGEAYKGHAKSGGVLDMLDVIKSDFERTISQTEKAEAEAEQDHDAYKDESGKVLESMKSAKTEKSGQLDDVEEQLESADTDLSSQTETLQHAVEELLELKPACIDTGMSYQERVDRRQDEINALKKGLCVLTKFKEYGVDNVAENC